jgi:hypothetical protein
MPETTPAGVIVAIPVPNVLHVPPGTEADSVTAVPMQKLVGPEITGSGGAAETVTVFVAYKVPQLLVVP